MTIQGNDSHELSHHALDRDQGRESGDRRQDTEDHGHRYFLRALDRALQPLLMPLLVGIDVLAHDDGVVDDDAEHQDEGEQGHQVNRHIVSGHEPDRTKERDRDPHAHPKGDSEPKEENERDENEE